MMHLSVCALELEHASKHQAYDGASSEHPGDGDSGCET